MTDKTKVEFAVKIKEINCLEEIKHKLINQAQLSENDIKSVVDDNEARIVISSDKPWIKLHEIIESCNVKSALVGFSDKSAVSTLDNETKNIKGVVRFCSIPNQKGIIIDGVIDGLKGSDQSISIMEYGDISDSCNNLGVIYQNSKYKLQINEEGRGLVRTIDEKLTIDEIIGRGVCINNLDKEKQACGVISRSAGIFQNYKRICLCSGRVLWDERDLQKMVGT